MSLPDKSKLESLAKKTTAEKEQLGLPTTYVDFWSSSEFDAYEAYGVKFGDGYSYYGRKYDSFNKVLCVGN